MLFDSGLLFTRMEESAATPAGPLQVSLVAGAALLLALG
jgi:hypothetical protein